MRDQQKKVLDEIVRLEGDCLKDSLCRSCPLKNQCLVRFMYKDQRWSKKERMVRAADVLARVELMHDSEL